MFNTGALCFPSPQTQIAMQLPEAKKSVFDEISYSTGEICVAFDVKISLSDFKVQHAELGALSDF